MKKKEPRKSDRKERAEQPHGAGDERLSPIAVRASRLRRIEAMHLQEIEDNPLSPEQVAMFEMFEREAWSHERCRAYIRDRALELAGK